MKKFQVGDIVEIKSNNPLREILRVGSNGIIMKSAQLMYVHVGKQKK